MGLTYRILYVEDEKPWEELLRGHVERVNRLRLNEKFQTRFDIVCVDSVEDFLTTLASSGPFDLAFIDLNLRGDAPTDGKGTGLLYQLKHIEGAPPASS